MADASQLSKRERQIMDVIFLRGEATISQVLAEMPDHGGEGASGAPAGRAGDFLSTDAGAGAGGAVGDGEGAGCFL